MAHNAKINVYLEQREGYEKQLAESQAKLEELTKKLESLEVLKKAFSTSGLVAYELENLVKDLEQLTNKYLADLSDGRFTLEFVMSGDKLNVVVTDNGMDINILSTSSGERARINTATLLAIRNLMQSISKSTINVLFLDETVSVLDDLGKERLVEVLLKEHNLNTFVVSHGWSHPLVSKMEIKQEDGLSRIENG
jgi:DNA repair exonuclease SbcCD ATPase subunit